MTATATLHASITGPRLAAATETGALGLYQLKRLWSRSLAARHGAFFPATVHDRHLDHLVIHASGLGLEQTLGYLGSQAPSFEDFERWIVATHRRHRSRSALRASMRRSSAHRRPRPARQVLDAIEASAPVLTDTDLSFWRENGYVVLARGVHARAIRGRGTRGVGACRRRAGRSGDLVPAQRPRHHGAIFPAPGLRRRAHARRASIKPSRNYGAAPISGLPPTASASMRPSATDFKFPGPHLHWDVSVKTPIPFGTGGILYLTDTPPEQGAFTLVPGFQRWGEDWLKSLPGGADPRAQDLYALGPKPSAAAPAISSSGIRRCRTAPAPIAEPSRGWCNTSTWSRRITTNRRSGFK